MHAVYSVPMFNYKFSSLLPLWRGTCVVRAVDHIGSPCAVFVRLKGNSPVFLGIASFSEPLVPSTRRLTTVFGGNVFVGFFIIFPRWEGADNNSNNWVTKTRSLNLWSSNIMENLRRLVSVSTRGVCFERHFPVTEERRKSFPIKFEISNTTSIPQECHFLLLLSLYLFWEESHALWCNFHVYFT